MIAASSISVTKRYTFKSIEGFRLLPCSKDERGISIKLVTNDNTEAIRPTLLAGIWGSHAQITTKIS
jgi:hypothetical protein